MSKQKKHAVCVQYSFTHRAAMAMAKPRLSFKPITRSLHETVVRAAAQSTLVKRTRYQYLIIGTCIMYLDMYRNECLPGTPAAFGY